ncbi:DlpA protein (isocitrate and isopropylmalate dehydrogenase family protein) [Legionella santicrucis]|uniref:Putative 4-hydroxy-4-methyl-2-oxoglutarate aldolase n=1 Tax=Legionella santicrucis TaxID=45074 RepID=A0A0W0YJB6_9GAMM|nr:RraA family protein [Legionella santicrucis]KTD56751.1 DlpA protein (isocitrate and isopropylmalate dehydrogenase family protein) [Legionella santicrucis]
MKQKIESYKEICQRLSHLTTSSICDALPTVRLMDPDITSYSKEEYPQCIGRAYPINSAQDSLSTMQALDDLSGFLTYLDCSDDIVPIVLMIASYNTNFALAGGMCTEVAKIKGFGGIITDGACRDLKEIRESNLPFFAKGKCAKSGTKDKIGTIRVTTECGGVSVHPGDIVFADIDGVVVMSKEEAVMAIEKGEEIQRDEALAIQRIKEGARFNEICNLEEHMKNIEAGTPSKLHFTL